MPGADHIPPQDQSHRPDPDTSVPDASVKTTAQSAAWCTKQATRAAVLVDGAAYYYALRQAMRQARRSIYIVGWDVDGRTPMGDPADPPDDGLPLALRDLLIALVKRTPELEIRILLWDFTVLYSLSREMLPTLSLGWATPDRIHLGLDDAIPLEAAQHQKLVVIDDAVAFCGGMDIALRRWDTSEHRPGDARRIDPDGELYPAVHDAAMAVEGPAARALGDHVRERWRLAIGETIEAPEVASSPWPEALPGAPALPPVVGGPCTVTLARTTAAYNGHTGAFEILGLYLSAIKAARRFIYIENQYLSSRAIAEALIARLEAPDPPDVILVTTRDHDGWLEGVTMGAARTAFLQTLARRGVRDRVRVVYPWVKGTGDKSAGRSGIKVHAKLMIVDDATFTIGSANLANRSLGLDCEMNLAIKATTEGERTFIAATLHRLLGEHTGAGSDAVAASLAETGSLAATVDALGDGSFGRGLAPLPDGDPEELDRLEPLIRLGDPEKPIDMEDFLMHEAPPPMTVHRRPVVSHLWIGIGLLCVVLALVLAWRFTPLSEMVDPDTIHAWLEDLRGPWTPFAVIGLFVGLGLVAFPVTVLIAASAALFGPFWGFGYALTGALASAGVGYMLGHFLGRDLIRRYAGHTINSLSRRLGRQGILAVIIVRTVPVAPFTVINLIAGASHVKALDFMAGTAIGMLPGMIVMTLFGSSLMSLLDNPQPHHILLMGAIITLWITVSVVMQRVASRVRARRAMRNQEG